MAAFTTARDTSVWDWTLLLLVPDWLGADDVAAAVERTRAKRTPARLDDVRHETLAEGLRESVCPSGTHHEIYLSDVRRTAPERRRTILRQPVTRSSVGSA